MAPLLQIEGCTKRFGGLVANRDVSLAIEPREIVGLIGPNGAGKTTLFNCISGALHPDEGRIVLDGTDISRARPERVCRLGIARTWQVVRSFGRMTVLENVICGALRRTNRIGPARARALELLAFTGLAGKEDVMAAALTLADKKRLEITRALATSPRLLLLDEAMSGLTPFETTAAVELVRRIHDEMGLAICVVEHVMEVVMPLSHRVVVLDHGEKLTEGPPAEVARDERVITAYLGDRYRAAARAMRRAHLLRWRGRTLNVQDVRLACGLRAPPAAGPSLELATGERRRQLLLRCATPTWPTARAWSRSRACRSRCGPARRWPWSGPTARARPRCSRPSPGSCRPGAARSGSTAAASTTSRRRTASDLGIALVPEGRRLFSRLSVAENLRLGTFRDRDPKRRQEMLERVFGLFPVLRQRVDQRAGTLSGGEGQMLSIARALMSRPRFLMLDEPSLGIMPRIVDSILDVLQMLHRQEGLTVLLVEQNVPAALAAAERGYVLQTGRIVAEGTSQTLLDSDLVRRAYLGM